MDHFICQKQDAASEAHRKHLCRKDVSHLVKRQDNQNVYANRETDD